MRKLKHFFTFKEAFVYHVTTRENNNTKRNCLYFLYISRITASHFILR